MCPLKFSGKDMTKKARYLTAILLPICALVSSCAVDPGEATLSTESYAQEMSGVFDVVESENSRAGFTHMTVDFNRDGKTGSLVYDYASGIPSMHVQLFDCKSFSHHIYPGIMRDDASVEQTIHEVRCRSIGSIWRAAIFRKGVPGTRISASLNAATGYEFAYTVPFTSTFAVQPHVNP